MTAYSDFMAGKLRHADGCGFEPLSMPPQLFDFQRSLAGWAIRLGRSAIFADCGLGKTAMQLTWADNVARKTNQPVLILTPLAVSHQTCREGAKFGIECSRSGDGRFSGHIVATNYERLHYFDCHEFAGVVCDESSILKNATGHTRKAVTEFMRTVPYRLLCTATAAPNDFEELGTSSEALGGLGHSDMLTRFFKQVSEQDYLGWGRVKYRLRGHAEQPFWRWVCSWARACRKPSDIGFSDDGYALPPLDVREVIVESSTPRNGMLFSIPARSLPEQREERRVSIRERCDLAARIAMDHDGASVLWCHLNDEAKELVKRIPGSVEVSGSMSDDEKEEKLLAFQSGQIQRLVTKPKIGCFGLNWQHCDNVITFPSHSFEQYYQQVRRCWRFGQMNRVKVSVIGTEGERGVLANLQRKDEQCQAMFRELVRHMNDAFAVDSKWVFPHNERIPSWLSSTSA